MNKRLRLERILYLSLFVVLFVTIDVAKAADSPNVLFIISDDLNCYLGCYGDKKVKTPNIDRLANQGVLFERAYCQFAVCNASRASFMTGLRPDRTGVYDNGTHFRSNVPDAVTLPQHFRNHGYFAARVGKVFHYGVPAQIGTNGKDDPPSWDHRVNPNGRDKAEEAKVFSLIPGSYGGTLSWLSSDGTADEQTDGLIATAAISLLKENGNRARPLFLAVGFFRPHTPYVAPHRFFDLYPMSKMSPPQFPADDRENMSPLAFFHKPEQDAMTPELQRQARQAYAASISLMDEQVGRLLDALDELKLDDKTVIVFTSDHGYHMGEHHYWQKESLFEESARVPLIMSVPKIQTAGQRCKAICELIDVYPTLADVCGLPKPAGLDGVSLKPQLVAPTSLGKDAAFTQAVRYKGRFVNATRKMSRDVHGYSVRTAAFRFTSWDDGKEGEELYDLERDPREMTNVASEADYQAHLVRLRDLVQQMRGRTQ